MTDHAAADVRACDHHYEHQIRAGEPLTVSVCLFCRMPDWADLREQVDRIRDAVNDTASDTAQHPADLREQYARAIRDAVRVRLGTNALRLAREGRPVMLNMSEAEAAADAVLAVRGAARQAAGQPAADEVEPTVGDAQAMLRRMAADAGLAAGQPAAEEQCGKWGGCILSPGHTGPHRHSPRSAEEPQDHPGAELYAQLRKAGNDHETTNRLIYAHARMITRQHQALNADTPAAGLAAPTNHNTETEARAPRSTWRVEGYDADRWLPLGMPEEDRETAVARRASWEQRLPETPTRLVRETTTWTVEDDTTNGAQS
ncbi:hypothetical protein [Streptomyces sp. NPDC013740]|uniref:hypothetical protein n=1 Tax=Streptomyces sp. NPDC013740 TaxID=3364867 RepID=UPI00370236FC